MRVTAFSALHLEFFKLPIIVDSFMSPQDTSVTETFVTNLVLERRFNRVHSFMFLAVTRMSKTFLTGFEFV